MNYFELAEIRKFAIEQVTKSGTTVSIKDLIDRADDITQFIINGTLLEKKKD